jgi:hypothetical protein
LHVKHFVAGPSGWHVKQEESHAEQFQEEVSLKYLIGQGPEIQLEPHKKKLSLQELHSVSLPP